MVGVILRAGLALSWSAAAAVGVSLVFASILMKVVASEWFAWGMDLTIILVASVRLGGEVLIDLGVQGVELSVFWWVHVDVGWLEWSGVWGHIRIALSLLVHIFVIHRFSLIRVLLAHWGVELLSVIWLERSVEVVHVWLCEVLTFF